MNERKLLEIADRIRRDRDLDETGSQEEEARREAAWFEDVRVNAHRRLDEWFAKIKAEYAEEGISVGELKFEAFKEGLSTLVYATETSGMDPL